MQEHEAASLVDGRRQGRFAVSSKGEAHAIWRVPPCLPLIPRLVAATALLPVTEPRATAVSSPCEIHPTLRPLSGGSSEHAERTGEESHRDGKHVAMGVTPKRRKQPGGHGVWERREEDAKAGQRAGQDWVRVCAQRLVSLR